MGSADSYFAPDDLQSALARLGAAPMTVLAGGTDLYPAKVGRASLGGPILDISRITALQGIRHRDGYFRIGAAATWTDLLRADLPSAFDGLKQAAREVGSVQIQNVATIAGNLCNASPAADGVPPLLTLKAQVELASDKGVRRLPIEEFILGNRKTALKPGELLTTILVPEPLAPTVSGFEKLGSRSYLVISIVMVGAVLMTDPDGRIASARVAVGACSPVAKRLAGLEARLIDQPIGPGLGDLVNDSDLAALSPIDDVRASAAYRLDATLEVTRRLLDRLGGGAA